MRAGPPSTLSRAVTMLALVVAGEAVFGLPFHVARFFRPTLLQVFSVDNTELGGLFSVYGLLAMACYLPGGPVADRFSARRLLTASLLSTGVSGFYMATIPSYGGLLLLFGFFGITTILLFWAALIRATREWGGENDQGKAFGILDGGRGLFAAALASAALLPFNLALGEDPAAATDAQRIEALRSVILVYTASTISAGVLVWFFVPESGASDASGRRLEWSQVGRALKMPPVWLQALIVICAYSAYKGTDNYSLFAVEAYGMNEVQGAQVSIYSAWIRPVAAIGAGLIADRISPTKATFGCFAVLFVSFAVFAFSTPDPQQPALLWFNLFTTCTVIFGLRGIYFAIMEEVEVPTAITGTAVGIISLIGFTPDVFIGPIAGVLLDRSPGAQGHQHFFMVLMVFAGVGLAATSALRALQRRA